MIFQLECRYCGNKWIRNAFSRESLNVADCYKCHDKHLKVRLHEDVSIDEYIGCPPFLEDIIDPSDYFGDGN